MPVTTEAVQALVRRAIPLTVRWAHHLGPAVDGLAEALDERDLAELTLATARLRVADDVDAAATVCLVARTADRLVIALRDASMPAADRVTAIPLAALGEPTTRRRLGRGTRVTFASGFTLTFGGRRGRRFAAALPAVPAPLAVAA